MIHLKEASVAAIIPAAGSGRRFGAEQNKLFATLAGEPLWVHSVRKLQQRPEIGRIISLLGARSAHFNNSLRAFMMSPRVSLALNGYSGAKSVRIAFRPPFRLYRVTPMLSGLQFTMLRDLW